MTTQFSQTGKTLTRRGLLTAVAAYALAPRPTHAQEPSVTVPSSGNITIAPGFYTLAEAAKLLSAPGDTVRCASALRSRAVLLALTDRPLDFARRSLCETLGLTLIPFDESRSQWLLEPDPRVTKRHAAWHDAYVDRAATSLIAYVSRAAKCIGKQTHSECLTATEARSTKLPGFAEPTATGKKSSVFLAWWRTGLFYDELLHPCNWLAIRQLNRRASDLRRILKFRLRPSVGDEVRLTPFSPTFSFDTIPSTQMCSTEFAALHDTFAERLFFDPLHQTFALQTATFFYGEANDMGTFAFPCSTPKREALFAALGDDAAAYLLRSQARTEAFFNLPQLKRPVSLPEGDGASLSATLLAWCRATKTEIVAEVQPLRDRLALPTDTERFRLADLVPSAKQTPAGTTDTKANLSGLLAFQKLIADIIAMPDQESLCPLPPSLLNAEPETPNDLPCWDFHLGDDNLLRVADRLAFLDRAYDCPMDLPLALWRRREARRAAPAPRPLPDAPCTWDELFNVLLSCMALDMTGWVRLGLETQWGFPIEQMAKALPFLPLLARAGLTETGALKEERGAKGRLVIPVAACGPDAAGQITDILRRQGFWCPNAFHPRFAEFLGGCYFVILRGKTEVPDYGDEPPPPGTPRVAANTLSIDLHDLTNFGTRTKWDPNAPDLEGYWILPRGIPILKWAD